MKKKDGNNPEIGDTRHVLTHIISQALTDIGIEHEAHTVYLEHPAELSHGDYATNAAMQFAKHANTSPKELGAKIADAINNVGYEIIDEVNVAGPGFINIKLSDDFFHTYNKSLQNQSWEQVGDTQLHEGKKIIVEHTSPNLFKPFHVGHAMTNAIGESMARIMKSSGAQVVVLSYPSDVSLGIAKALYALIKKGGMEMLDSVTDNPEAAMDLFGECYVEGTKIYDESPDDVLAIRGLVRDLYNGVDNEAYAIYEKAKALNLDYFYMMTGRLGSQFDGFIFESEAAVKGKEIVENHTGEAKIFNESQGAVIYPGEQDGLHTRVFINAEGNPTYEGKDIGLISLKHDRYNPDISVIVTDHEQGPYFKVMSHAAGKINKEWQDAFVHVMHGRMTWKGEKMSSRLGNVMRASELLETIGSEAKARLEASPYDTSESLVDQIAIAALRFTILRVQPGKNLDFDPDRAISFQGDSGPYLQYTHARMQSLLGKAKEMNINHSTETARPDDWQTIEVEHLLPRFVEIVEKSQKSYESHHIIVYLLELVHAYNRWYSSGEVFLNSDAPEVSVYRMLITENTQKILRKGLHLLGIDAPERM